MGWLQLYNMENIIYDQGKKQLLKWKRIHLKNKQSSANNHLLSRKAELGFSYYLVRVTPVLAATAPWPALKKCNIRNAFKKTQESTLSWSVIFLKCLSPEWGKRGSSSCSDCPIQYVLHFVSEEHQACVGGCSTHFLFHWLGWKEKMLCPSYFLLTSSSAAVKTHSHAQVGLFWFFFLPVSIFSGLCGFLNPPGSLKNDHWL